MSSGLGTQMELADSRSKTMNRWVTMRPSIFWTMIDHERFSGLIEQLYGIVEELERMFPGRPFTPDGHIVGGRVCAPF